MESVGIWIGEFPIKMGGVAEALGLSEQLLRRTLPPPLPRMRSFVAKGEGVQAHGASRRRRSARVGTNPLEVSRGRGGGRGRSGARRLRRRRSARVSTNPLEVSR